MHKLEYKIIVQFDLIEETKDAADKYQRIERAVDSNGQPLDAYFRTKDIRYTWTVHYKGKQINFTEIMKRMPVLSRELNVPNIIPMKSIDNKNCIVFVGDAYATTQYIKIIVGIADMLSNMFGITFDIEGEL